MKLKEHLARHREFLTSISIKSFEIFDQTTFHLKFVLNIMVWLHLHERINCPSLPPLQEGEKKKRITKILEGREKRFTNRKEGNNISIPVEATLGVHRELLTTTCIFLDQVTGKRSKGILNSLVR